MTSVKMFVIGALLGTLFGATFLGAISHLLIIALAVVGAGALAMAGAGVNWGSRAERT